MTSDQKNTKTTAGELGTCASAFLDEINTEAKKAPSSAFNKREILASLAAVCVRFQAYILGATSGLRSDD